MKKLGLGKNWLVAATVAGLATTAAPVSAQSLGDAFVKGFGESLGNRVGDCVTGRANCNGKRRTVTTNRAPSSQVWSPARQQRASVQRALNDFGYPVGSPDGVYGGNTRRGMSQYQAGMGLPVTGQLNPWEEQALLQAHNSYTTGMHNSTYPGLYQSEGLRGLARAAMDPNYYNNWRANNNQGIPQNHGGNEPVWVNNNPQQTQPTQNFGNAPRSVGFQDSDQGLAPIGQQAGLAPIGQIGEVEASMQDHCDIVKLATQTNGGQILANSMTNPDQALSEQFCDARTFLMGRVQNVLGSSRATEEQLIASCEQIAGKMQPVMDALATKAPEAINAQASGISGSLGLTSPAQAAEYGEVCIGLGYRSNDADMALAGAVMLTGAGRTPYSEMVGHHVREGFGTAGNSQVATSWYNLGLDALANNEAPAVLPNQTIQRAAIIRSAVSGDRTAQGGNQPAQQPLLVPLSLGNN